jgi:hypothetical protein
MLCKLLRLAGFDLQEQKLVVRVVVVAELVARDWEAHAHTAMGSVHDPEAGMGTGSKNGTWINS